MIQSYFAKKVFAICVFNIIAYSYRPAFLNLQAVASLGLKRHDEAVATERLALLSPNASHVAYLPLISALGHLGRIKEAEEAIQRLHQLQPGYSCRRHKGNFPDFDSFAEYYVEGLRKAGLPEE